MVTMIVQRKAWTSSEAISGQLNTGHVGQHKEEQKHNEFHEFTRLLLTRQPHHRYVQCTMLFVLSHCKQQMHGSLTVNHGLYSTCTPRAGENFFARNYMGKL